MIHILKKSDQEIENLRKGGKKLAQIMETLEKTAHIGINTGELGMLAEKLILENGGEPVFKGYGAKWGAPPFPAAVCLSLNNEVVHGIPKEETILREGDLLKIDIGMRFEGMVTDMARTFSIGNVSPLALRLWKTAKESLQKGIASIHPGAHMEDYARSVEAVIEREGFSAVRDLVGHGVGHKLHEEPQIPNYGGSKLPNFLFEPGMVVALEPMINTGHPGVKLSSDGWTFVTTDGSLSAHWEDTVLVTDKGTEVLTLLS